MPIPKSYFCILVDPFEYPWDIPSKVDIASFLIPQNAKKKTPLSDFLVELEVVEKATKLEFFPGWRSEIPEKDRNGLKPSATVTLNQNKAKTRHRLLKQF